MHQQLQRNFDVIQYLIKNASLEQLAWRKDKDSRSLADVLCHLCDVEKWNASIRITDTNGHNFSAHQAIGGGHVFDTYARYRRQTMTLLQKTPRDRCVVSHKLFGKMPLAQLVDVMDEYDQIHINQLENVIKEMPFNPLLARALKEIGEYHGRYRSHLAQASSVLDIGMGSGLALQHVMQQNSHLTAVGIDIRDLRLPDVNAPLQIYDGYTIPFVDNQFDVSLIFYVLHHCEDPEQVLREAIRVTRGKIIIIEEFDRPNADETSLDLTERQSHRALGIPSDLHYQLFEQSEFEQALCAQKLVQLDRQLLPSKTTRPVDKYLYVVESIE